MNTDNINALADFIEHRTAPNFGFPPKSIAALGFNMATFWAEGFLEDYEEGGEYEGWELDSIHIDRSDNECGTLACIAGWANVLETGNVVNLCPYIESRAQKFLKLSSAQAAALFWFKLQTNEENDPRDNTTLLGMSDVTPTQAAAVLRNLAATGIVDWPKALEENPS